MSGGDGPGAQATRRTLRASDAELDAIVLRFQYELVRIHSWPNRNGRHARLAAEPLLEATRAAAWRNDIVARRHRRAPAA